VKSGIGRFSPVDSKAGVAKPPTSPSTAMKIDSRRIESSTATTVTSARSTNVATAGMRFHSEWAAKKVANRIAIAAASSALAVTAYLRAAFSSQTTNSAIATMIPIAIRTGGDSQPRSIE
jgi:hypothetical protein